MLALLQLVLSMRQYTDEQVPKSTRRFHSLTSQRDFYSTVRSSISGLLPSTKCNSCLTSDSRYTTQTYQPNMCQPTYHQQYVAGGWRYFPLLVRPDEQKMWYLIVRTHERVRINSLKFKPNRVFLHFSMLIL